MLIFDEKNEAIILDSIFVPTISSDFWILDLEQLDYTLAPIHVLEEVTCPTVRLSIRGFEFNMPANWNVLVYDSIDTMELDVVEASDLAGRDFTALVYGPDASLVVPGHIRVMDLIINGKNVYPALNKHQMLCHPISPDLWITIAPSDSYNKYLKGRVIGDII